MNAPTLAALAPGVDVSGRMVSAISSSKRHICRGKGAGALRHRPLDDRGLEREREQPVAAGERRSAQKCGDALHGLAPGHTDCRAVVHRFLPSHRLPRLSSSTANAAARAVSAM